jgi:hypothetical protein
MEGEEWNKANLEELQRTLRESRDKLVFKQIQLAIGLGTRVAAPLYRLVRSSLR